jgi:hypothetical protein
MDGATFSDLIGNLGFPIACVCALFYLLNKQREDHKAESAAWVAALNNNTAALTAITAKLDTISAASTATEVTGKHERAS